MGDVIEKRLKDVALEVQEYVRLCLAAFRGVVTPPFYWYDFWEQLDAVGVASLTVVVLTGFFTGAVLALQAGLTLDQFGARPVVGRLVSASMIKDLGPVLTALMLSGRVGSGIAAELGSMVVTDQINALRALGTDPLRKLVVPRVLAGILMAPVLTVISDGVGIVGGWVVARYQLQVATGLYWSSVWKGLYMQDLTMGLIKPFVLGFVIVTVACHVGLRTKGGTQGVGKATTAAVVAGSVGVIAVDFFITRILISVLYVGMAEQAATAIVQFDHVSLAFDEKVILKDISFIVDAGHTKIILGASGAGKSVTLKILLGLLKADAGSIWVHGDRVDQLPEEQMMKVRTNIGMVFQEGALFDSLTVRENVGYRLYEESDMPLEEADRRVEEVLGFIGLAEFIGRMPSELSGGQRRRVAIARAMASKPKLLLYDEPTTGLDPITATTVDDEIIKLRDLEGVTSIVVTHQLRDAFYVATHKAVRENGVIRVVPAEEDKAEQCEFIMIRDGLIVFEGDADELRHSQDVYLKTFLS